MDVNDTPNGPLITVVIGTILLSPNTHGSVKLKLILKLICQILHFFCINNKI